LAVASFSSRIAVSSIKRSGEAFMDPEEDRAVHLALIHINAVESLQAA
jgi:hypothetical protein